MVGVGVGVGWGGGGWWWGVGVSIQMCPLTSIGITMLKIRWSRDCLIFNMGIPIPGEDGLYIETNPGSGRHILTLRGAPECDEQLPIILCICIIQYT